MTRKRILIKVRPDGTVSASTQGVTGPSCLDEVNRIQALCGGDVSDSKLTEDYHVTPEHDQLSDRSQINEEHA